MRWDRARSVALITTVVAVAATAWCMVWPPDNLPHGLRGRYFATTDWSGEPILERIDSVLTTEALAATPELQGRAAYSVEWTGTLIVQRAGIHRFATKSDDGTQLWIDERLVVDNSGDHSVRNVTADVPLTRGAHSIRLRFHESGGGYFLQVGHAGPQARFAHPSPLVPQTVTYGQWQWRELWPLALVFLWYFSIGSLLVVAWRSGAHRLGQALADIWSDRWVHVIVVLGTAVSAAHIAYGIPAIPSFSADEIEPIDTLVSSRNGFRDWNLRWPPLHAFVLAGALQPFGWAESLFGLRLLDEAVIAAMFLITRGISIAMVAATLALTFDGTRLLADRRAGYFAAALLACAPVVVFFGSLGNLEIPQLFWVALTFWLFLRLLQRPDTVWVVLFGAAVGFSVATKDQAYGFYLLAPLALVAVFARDRGSWRRAFVDRRLIFVAGGALLAFAAGHALPWRVDRFVNRIPVMVGPASAPYQMFAATLDGHVALVAATAKCLLWAAGAPLVVAFAIGVAVCLVQGRALLLLALTLPILTYYASFLAVILYVYDRFLIGWLPIVAAIGGIGLAALTTAKGASRAVGSTVAIALLAAGALNAIAVSVVFARDPRHAGWQWLHDHVPYGSTIGVTFNGRYVPPLDGYDMWELTPGMVGGMVRWPQFLVLNEAYLQRLLDTPSGSWFVTALQSGTLGYRRVWRGDSSPPDWAPLYWEARFRNRREDVETTADKPLHAIEVWECVQRQGCDRPTSP